MWFYEGKEFSEEMVGSYHSFVYLITDMQTGRMYVGRKVFSFRRTLPALKGMKRKRKVVTPSDWQEYWSSSEKLKALVAACPDPAARFRREILHLCRTAQEAAYLETREIFARDALISPDYLNDFVSCRINSIHVKTL